MIRRFIAAAALCAIATGPAHATDPMKITVTGLVSGFADYFIATDKGYFAEEGIVPEIVQAGGSTATPALLSGDVQYSTSASIAITAILRGGELKIVYVNNDHVPYQLWTTQPAIQTLADLKGKQVGVETRGDTHELAMRAAFLNVGVDPATVIYTPLSNRSAIVASVMTGSLAAASMVIDEFERIKAAPNARLLFDLQKIELIAGGGVFSDKLLKENRPLAERFMRAVVKGRRAGRDNVEEIVNSVRKRNPAQSAEDIRTAVNLQRPLNTIDGTISLETEKLEIANRSDLLNIAPDKRRKPEQAFDFTLLKEANADLDRKGWKP